MLLSENLSRLWSSIIIDELTKSCVTDFYCAPGMRNAPILASIRSNTNASDYSFIDERSLAYRALGNAKKSGNIPVLTCTSGTAIANFLPAVIEAYKSGLPLIVLSADRPLELVKIDANQTIDQTNVLKDFLSFQISLEAPSTSLSPMRLRALISQAVSKAITSSRPVHINLPLREPLDTTKQVVSSDYIAKARESFNSTKLNITKRCTNFSKDADIENMLIKAKRPLLVIGKQERLIEANKLIQALKKVDIPKYLDATSGVKYAFTLEDKAIPSFDHPEVFNAWSENKPDLIIHLGGRLVSKHYYRFQEENPDIQVIHVTDVDTNHNPGFSNDVKILCSPTSFVTYLSELALSAAAPINWINFVTKKASIITNCEVSLPYISKSIIENIDGATNLLIANSMAIRSFDNYVSPKEAKLISFYANRGVSGIEGFLATIVGIADKSDDPNILIIGDISFKYDLNSLYMLNQLSNKNISIIIVNNYGGKIFERLPVAKDNDYLDLLTTPHEDNFKDLVTSFKNIKYAQVTGKQDFDKTIEVAKKNNGVNIIEVILSDSVNDNVYDELRTVKL